MKKFGFLLTTLLIISQTNANDFANVETVTVSGDAGNYRFSVTISSPDTGCEQYANWWEVLNADGELLYRRILAHSHVDEQPFTRSGGVVKATKNETLYIRAHLFPSGYGDSVFVGSAASGFKLADRKALEKVRTFTVETPKTHCAF